MAAFKDDFDADRLDPAVWDPHYLPHWGTRAGTAASYSLGDGRLRLDIPVDQGLWCPDQHETPLRASGIASGAHSGPVGSTVGGQPFLEGQTVREEQPRLEGWLPSGGEVAVRCRMEISPRSMAAVWLSGFEETPEQSGEICLVEVFGKDLEPGRSAEVGMGVKKLHDPALVHDFAAPRVPVDVTDVARLRRAVGRRRGGVHHRRPARPHLPQPADVPAAGDDRGLRLPGVVAR